MVIQFFFLILVFFNISGNVLKKFKDGSIVSFNGFVVDREYSVILAGHEEGLIKLDQAFNKIGVIEFGKFEDDFKNCLNASCSSCLQPSSTYPLSPQLFVICYKLDYEMITENFDLNNTFDEFCSLVNIEKSTSFCFYSNSDVKPKNFFILGNENTLIGAITSSKSSLSLHILNKDTFQSTNTDKATFHYQASPDISSFQQLIYSFNQNPYVYIFSIRHKTNTPSSSSALSSSTGSFLTRMCSEDISKSVVEVALKCSVGEGVKLDVVVDVARYQDYFFIAFESSSSSSSSNSQAICVYKKEDLEEVMDKVVDECFKSGQGFKESAFLNNIQTQTCTKTTSPRNKTYCSQYNFYHAIFADVSLKMDSYFKLGMCKNIVDLYVEENVLFVACKEGMISRFKLIKHEANSSLSLAELLPLSDLTGSSFDQSLAISANIRQLLAGMEESELYVLLGDSVSSVNKHTCFQHNTCEACSNEPFCGWCLYNKRCTSRKECEREKELYVFTSTTPTTLHHTNLCFQPYTISPTTIALPKAKSTRFNFTLPNNSLLPPILACEADCGDMVVVALDVMATISMVTKDSYVATCAAFSYLSDSLINHELSDSTLRVKLKWDGVVVGAAVVLLYDCSKIKSCSQCKTSAYPCVWCSTKHQCVSEQEVQCSSEDLNRCASIDFYPSPPHTTSLSPILLPTNHPTNIQLLARDLTFEMKRDLLCIIDTTHTFPATIAPLTPQEILSIQPFLIQFEMDGTNVVTKEEMGGVEKVVADKDAGGGVENEKKSVKLGVEENKNMKNNKGDHDKVVKSKSGKKEGIDIAGEIGGQFSRLGRRDVVAKDGGGDGEKKRGDVLHKVSCHVEMNTELLTSEKAEMGVEVGWGEGKMLLENPHKVAVEVYDCGLMGMNCGECLLIEKRYGCGYCNDAYCSYTCHVNPHTFKNDALYCSNPVIESFEPPGAPLNSINTTLTIHGHNLALSSDSLMVTVMGRQCEVSERTLTLFQAATRISCELPASSEEGSGRVGYGTKYPAWSALQFVYQNPEVKSIQPIKGPRSGSTHVTISGSNLDFGSVVQVGVNKVSATVLSRNSTSCIILTPPHDNISNSPATVRVVVDGVVVDDDKLRYNYVEDPTIHNVSPNVALVSGGSVIIIRGYQFNAIQKPQFIVYLPHTNVTTGCRIESHHNSYLDCLVPDLRQYHLSLPLQLEYGLVMDGVASLLRMKSVGSGVITYHPIPTIASLEEPFQYYHLNNNKKLILEGINVAVLNVFNDLTININHATCDMKVINDTNISCDLPEPHKVDLSDDMTADVMITLGNYKRMVGVVSYYKRSYLLHLMIGCLVTMAALVLIIIITTLLCVMRRKKKRKEYSNSFLLKPSQKSTNNNYNDNTNLTVPPTTTTSRTINNNNTPQHMIKRLPIIHDDESFFEVALQRIEGSRVKGVARSIFIGRDDIQLEDLIGQGSFSKVHLATIFSPKLPKLQRACVKVILDMNLSGSATEALIRDAAVMSSFSHTNVQKVVAISIGHHKQPWVVLPYMRNGDLKSHVKDKSKSFTARQLLQLSQKVAGGMAYLANLNFVHKQLCARNCLLDDNFEVKISDFGLTSELLHKDFHSSTRHVHLPLKWWAVESLENFVFTSKSDVWSYGVLLWELMTRGVTPYPDVPANQITAFLNSNRRLKKPKYCPNNVYQMMSECWLEIPERRPTFTDLVNRLELLLNPPKKRTGGSVEMGEPLYINHHDTVSPSISSPAMHSPSMHSAQHMLPSFQSIPSPPPPRRRV